MRYAVEVNTAVGKVLLGVFETLLEAQGYAGRYGMVLPIFQPSASVLEVIQTPNAEQLAELLKDDETCK